MAISNKILVDFIESVQRAASPSQFMPNGRRPNTLHPWPGNVRGLEQCISRVIMTGGYAAEGLRAAEDLIGRIQERKFTAKDLLSVCGRAEFFLLKTYSIVARNFGLDRRTVQKNVESQT